MFVAIVFLSLALSISLVLLYMEHRLKKLAEELLHEEREHARDFAQWIKEFQGGQG